MIKRRTMLGLSALLAACVLCAGSGTAFAANPVSDLHRIGKDRSTSTNWSGYAVYNGTYTDVQGSWTVPAANCNGMKGQQMSVAAAWVGLDGYDSRTVEQTGTDSDCIGKTAYYYAWYEFYPAAAVFPDGYDVDAGDSMTAHVYKSGTTVYTSLQNNTKGWTMTANTPSSGLDLSSAEWIMEAPSNKLTNFGTINFSNATANGAGLGSNTYSSSNRDAITMVSKNGRTTRATPSSLSGDSFTVTFNNP